MSLKLFEMCKAQSEPRVLQFGRRENHARFWGGPSLVAADSLLGGNKKGADSVNGDTDSTSSECESPDFIAYESRSSRRKQDRSSSSGICAGIAPPSHPQLMGSRLENHPVDSSSSSSRTTSRTHRSSNIPVQRPPRRTSDPDAAEEALQDHLKQHYAMRTWDMYHRITQGRKNKNVSPAVAASIDQITPQQPHTHTTSSPSRMLKAASVDSPSWREHSHAHLEQDMLFPLDE